MLQFSIRILLFVVAGAALFAAALANPSMAIVRVAVSVALILLFSCTLAAILSRSRRPFFVGSAVVGWSYYIAAVTPLLHYNKSVLLTEWVLEESAGALHEELEGTPSRYLFERGMLTEDGPEGKKCRFMTIGHGLWTIIFGTIGGVAGSWIAKSEDKKGPA